MIQFYLILSAIGDILITYFCDLVDSIVDFWKPLLIYPALVLGCLVLHFITFVLYSLTAKKGEDVTDISNSYRWLMIASLKLYFQLIRVRTHITGKELVPNDGKYLFVCNHISVYDPIVEIVEFADKKLSFVSKKENLEVPFAGKYLMKSGCLGLDRENDREAVKTINKAAKKITDGVCAMGIYPEGWVNKTDEELLPFRNGAFKIAKKAKVPIVVATVSNTQKVNDNILKRPTDVFVNVIKVLPYEEIAGLKTVEIGEKVRELMSSALHSEKIQKKKNR